MTKVICPKCGKRGSLTLKKTRKYSYWYIGHYIGYNAGTGTSNVKWCYVGKELPTNLEVLENES